MADQDGQWFDVAATPAATPRTWTVERLASNQTVLALLAVGVAIALALGGLWVVTSSANPRIDLGSLATDRADPSSPLAGGNGELLVDVAGAVRSPGLYRLPAGSRVGDAIAAAGGYGPSVDTVAVALQLNLAAPLSDGQKIAVPARGAVASAAGGSASGSGSGGLVDLNHASESELDALPGIGPATAKKIIGARAERPFASPDELVERKIVGQATWQKIRDLVTVS